MVSGPARGVDRKPEPLGRADCVAVPARWRGQDQMLHSRHPDMKQNYDACLTRVLRDEGGYSNDAHDPGGPTNFGITIWDYRRYINPHATAKDVRDMKLADAKTIYRERYWDAMKCDD